jgi:hypothetical protein
MRKDEEEEQEWAGSKGKIYCIWAGSRFAKKVSYVPAAAADAILVGGRRWRKCNEDCVAR